MTSLAELRAIEAERVEAERHAVVAEAEARRRAIEDAEQQRRACEAAQARAIHDAAVAVERARADAEREARLRIEAVEAAERARLVAGLEQDRQVQEFALRRAEVARKRPRWMVAVTALAIVAAAGLGWVAIDRQRASEQAQTQRAAAERDRAASRLALAEAEDSLVAVQDELHKLDTRVDKALVALEDARTAKARAKAAADLRRLRAQQVAVEQRRRGAAAAAALAKRRAGLILSDECKRNSLAKGCD